ncbi:MAG: chromosome segregation protein SMC [Thauera sp.]|nr:chromosome segregation protein SMC [Thauera sp.]
MRLDKIKLVGFKSFVDPTTIHLPSNLVGIVGPNGCGKSNTIDAVRWVMCESSAKHLRGDSMADVIFNGSSARKPVGHASVELVFDNSEGKIGGQYAQYNEISVKRQVSRDGTLSYFLNGVRCRRRDITDIFLGTGLGPRSYSIIEQGMISRLIEARPEDLRVYLEEAAGISKYKERRRETENRIKHTHENLSRLNDLREEIEKQIEKLQRQARTAERYKELKQQERRVRAELLTLKHQKLQHESAESQRQIQELETALEAVIAEQRALEAGIEKAREAQIEANDAFNEVQGRFYGLGAEIARVEQAIQHGKDTRTRQQQELAQADKAWNEVEAHIEVDTRRLAELQHELSAAPPEHAELQARAEATGERLREAEAAMQTWQAEWDDFNRRAAEPQRTAEVERTRIDQLERQLLQLAQRLERIGSERQYLAGGNLGEDIVRLDAEVGEREQAAAQLQSELDQLRNSINELREQSQAKMRQLDGARRAQQDTRGRLVSLEALQQAALGQTGGAVTDWLRGQGLDHAPRLAQQLQVEPGWERAVETVLGDYLEAVCVDGVDRVADALASLAQGNLTVFDTAQSPQASSGALSPLADKVQAPWSLAGVLGGVYRADSLDQALARRADLAAHESIVTRDGVWIGAGWLRVRHAADDKAGIIEREREIKQLNKQLQEQDEELAALEAALEQAREDLQASEQRRDDLQVAVNQAHRAHSETRAQLSTRRAQHEQLQTRLSAIAQEAEELAAQRERVNDEHGMARHTLSEALTLMEQLAGERDRRSAEREARRADLDQARAQAQADRDRAHDLAIRIESMRTAQTTTGQSLERMRGQQVHLRERREQLTAALADGEAPLAGLQEELAQFLARRSEVETELADARRTVEDIDHRLRGDEQQRAARERSAQEIRERLSQLRIAMQETKVRTQTLLEQLAETGFALEALIQEMPEHATIDAWATELEQLEGKIQRLGPINLAAIEEFEEQSQRKTYLDAQHADLTEALETLDNAIRKIDRETRTRFKETFDKVNAGLQRMFPRLFGGGHAYLELTGEDLLDTGVSVMARPPGKRNSTIHLLSGGEKALTAVAMVFAIFELNPSPFCMLDEVDAPLDDANVGRFCDMVREMSSQVQFIFITHNKITMELSNQLMGVTMHEPGVSRLVAVDVDEAAKMAAM